MSERESNCVFDLDTSTKQRKIRMKEGVGGRQGKRTACRVFDIYIYICAHEVLVFFGAKNIKYGVKLSPWVVVHGHQGMG